MARGADGVRAEARCGRRGATLDGGDREDNPPHGMTVLAAKARPRGVSHAGTEAGEIAEGLGVPHLRPPLKTK